MKTLRILTQGDAGNHEVPPCSVNANTIIKFLLVVFILSGLAFLPSCAVEMRSPQYGSGAEYHQHHSRHTHGDRHNHDNYQDHNVPQDFD